MRIIGNIASEGFDCTVTEDDDGRIFFMADGDIDADGANGQNGRPAAYTADNAGSELLANGGMMRRDGRVFCKEDWARDIVILDVDNEPKVFPGGVIASMTWYRHPGKSPGDPTAYVDSETIPDIVVPRLIVQGVSGVVRGCRARVSRNGRSVDCVVADKGPANKIGELSIAAARAIGLDPSPRIGGTDRAEIFYELWPGQAADGFVLQPT